MFIKFADPSPTEQTIHLGVLLLLYYTSGIGGPFASFLLKHRLRTSCPLPLFPTLPLEGSTSGRSRSAPEEWAVSDAAHGGADDEDSEGRPKQCAYNVFIHR